MRLLKGLAAFAGYSALVTGVTSTLSMPAFLKISQANSYQLHSPSLVA